MIHRATDWLAQAERDLEMARIALREARHDWACFAAQQAAAMASRAGLLAQGREDRPRGVAQALAASPIQAPQALLDKANVLDAHFFTARFPNAHLAGAPYQHYSALQSEQAIGFALDVIAFVRPHVLRTPKG